MSSTIAGVVAGLDWADSPPLTLPTTVADSAVGELGPGPLRWIAGVVETGIDELLGTHDADVLAPWEDLHPFAQAHLVDVLRGLTSPDGHAPGTQPAVFDPAFADVFVREVPLARVLDTVATFHNRCLTMLVEHAITTGGDSQMIATIVHDATRITNQWIQAHAESYLAESRRHIDSSYARTRALIESLIAGEPVESLAVQSIGVTVDGWHLGCVIAALPGRAMDHRALDRVAAAFERGSRADSTLRYETSTGQVWLWSSGTRRPRLLSSAELPVAEPLVVGIGRVHGGAAGLRRTHLEAMDAAVALRTFGVSAAAGIDDVSLLAMLSTDIERARWFVERELKDLAGDDAQSGDLRDTLRAFYTARTRVAPAAEHLFLHRNTLINRLGRVEALLGHSVAERTAEVQAALVLHDSLSRGRAHSFERHPV